MVQRKRLGNSVSALLILALCAASWAADKSTAAKADRVVIVKSARTLTLFNHGQVLKTYQVALGGDPVGAKTKAGDQKTPEGEYVIDSKNPHSRLHLALHISYPNAPDRERARKLGASPGGGVEIHGLEAKYAWVGSLHRQINWTAGCIAVTDPEIKQITNSFRSVRRLKSGGDEKPVEHSETVDPENRIAQVDGAWIYGYDGDGRRVEKVNGSQGTLYWTGMGSDALSESDLAGNVGEEYVFFNGQRVARVDRPSSTVHYYFSDRLGSARVVTDANGNLQQQSDYFPYGGEIVINAGDPNHYKFNGKERDSESGLDNFGARYNASSMGRFMSPDPLWIKANRMIDPQRLNLYAYGRNNPLKFTDPTGMDVVIDKCSGGDAQKCFNTALKGLQKEDRSHVHLVTGDGKNGFAKGQFGVTVDADYKSSSKNFSILQNLANDHSGVASLNVVGPKDTFSSNVGVQQGAQVTLQSFKSIYGVGNYVSSKDAVPGQTLYPLVGSPLANVIYSTGKNAEVYVANDEPEIEIVKTTFHELTHVFLGDFGRSVPKALEDAPGVKPQLDRAEQEAGQNFKQ